MKKLLLILLYLPMIVLGQSFYISDPVGQIEPDESLFFEIKGAISSKLLQLEKEETKLIEVSTYTITPIITKLQGMESQEKDILLFMNQNQIHFYLNLNL